MLRGIVSLVVLMSLASPCPVRPAELTGEVVRPPAKAKATTGVNRYRERKARRDDAGEENAVTACGCRPSELAVVYLTGPDLPEARMPVQPPVMAQKDRAFVPSVLAIPVGATVEFPNLDPYFHNVFSYSKTRKFDLGRYPEGEAQSVRFEQAGIVPIFCEIHYSMRAYIHVLDTPYFAVSDGSRRFAIPQVSPGDYTLHLWQENLPTLEIPVTVGNEPLHLVVP